MVMKKQEVPEEDATQNFVRRKIVPVIYTSGTHYEIGFNVGETFAEMIRNYVDQYWPLTDTNLPLYECEKGRLVYDDMLACVEKQYPQYVRELQGTADGSGVPFHKLFLMHLNEIMPNVADNGAQGNPEPVGCTAIICNQPEQKVMGHNEDCLIETLNHWYVVDAHVIEQGYPEEKFCSLCSPGFLPGYAMGYNHHGLVYTINTLRAKTLRSRKTSRYFLARALLGAENLKQVEKILENDGFGAADGMAVNMSIQQEGRRLFYNVEVAPVELGQTRSVFSTITISPGEHLVHCNRYFRLPVAEVPANIESSIHREEAISKNPPPENIQDVINLLSDQTDIKMPVYRENSGKYMTVATGIFDLVKKTWSLYTDKPSRTKPVVVLPLRFKDDL